MGPIAAITLSISLCQLLKGKLLQTGSQYMRFTSPVIYVISGLDQT
jgi:hypothetical protein